MKLKNICFIVPNYPYKEEMKYIFVKQIVEAIADSGIKCTVIAPQSLTNRFIRKSMKRPFYRQDITLKGSKIDIYQPTYLSISKLKVFGWNISSYFNERAIERTYNKINIKPDVLYAHFWHCGITASVLGRKCNIPVFVTTGESKITVNNVYKKKKILKSLNCVKGVICVSQKNLKESYELGLAPKEKMIVIPNAVNRELFFPMDKKTVRKELMFNQDDFIVAFIGAFIHRKGVLRLSEAVKRVGGVKTIYIGSGKEKPYDEDILFCGRLSHEKIPKYLNAADVFVLPTLAEGCCNAIIEAMACGLPIISSDLPFNDDIIDKANSIRIDSANIHQIAEAIQYLRDNPQIREEMSKASLIKAKKFDIKVRAKKIIDFIETMVDTDVL